MNCTACGAANRAGRRFCGQCGATLERLCPSCGAPNDEGERFCGECGAGALVRTGGRETGPRVPAPTSIPRSRRRRAPPRHACSSRTWSASRRSPQQRDAEDVRELLSRYFDTARTIIARYGGTVEKFIGDAVMAVWGVPTVRENDAERAVRAALELVDAVAAFGEEVGAPGLRARAGLLTGEVAVNLGDHR